MTKSFARWSTRASTSSDELFTRHSPKSWRRGRSDQTRRNSGGQANRDPAGSQRTQDSHRTAGGRAALHLAAGADLVIEVGDFVGEPGRIATTAAELPKAVKPGNMLLLDDGRIQLTVTATSDRAIETRVVDGGELGERKESTLQALSCQSRA